jgi:hypothetical protein
VDVTNVPTDFSKHEKQELEVVFTQHPACFVATARDAAGRFVEDAWVLIWSADPKLWQPWATTSHAGRAGSQGAFRICTLPGRYLARAFPPFTFASYEDALRQLARFAPGAVTARLADRERKSIRLTVDKQ